MANLREIIANSTQGEREFGATALYACDESGRLALVIIGTKVYDGSTVANITVSDGDAEFIRTYDPKHIALMEAVIANIDPYGEHCDCRWCGSDVLEPHSPSCEWKMLDDYRTERGYEWNERTNG